MENFPVTESTASAIHLARFPQEKYSLSPETTCTLFRTGINHLYLITDGYNKFVFRMYAFDWRSTTEISEEVRLLNHLKENNIPVSYPIADRKNNFIQEINAPEGMRYGVLFSFAEGRKMAKFTPQTSYNIGLAMARMHQVTENFMLYRTTYTAKVLLQYSSN